METMTIRASAFENGQAIPKAYSGEGKDESPALEWSGVPAGAKELVLIVDDTDAPTREPWVHWLMWGISPEVKGVPAGVRKMPVVHAPIVAEQGKNSFGHVGYNGPLPPKGHGVHHYHFRIYALDAVVKVPAGATREVLERGMKGHVIGEGEVVGTYERK